MEITNAVMALGALAQETRLSVFRKLVQAGEQGCKAGELAQIFGVPNSSLSFHLKELNAAGLITSRQEGRFVIYQANFDQANDLIGFLMENCCQGCGC